MNIKCSPLICVLQEKLSYNYKVRGIPTLVLLDKNGKTITKDGRNIASEMETAGDLVRWTREPRISDFRATFTKEPLINKDGDFQLNPDKYEVIGEFLFSLESNQTKIKNGNCRPDLSMFMGDNML